MAGKQIKKFIILERDKDQGGPFIQEDTHGIIYFDDYEKAKEYGANHMIDPTIINMY